jgi:hypothetical protein
MANGIIASQQTIKPIHRIFGIGFLSCRTRSNRERRGNDWKIMLVPWGLADTNLLDGKPAVPKWSGATSGCHSNSGGNRSNDFLPR